jgi:sRNA-binding carbon storage regulator CsrA
VCGEPETAGGFVKYGYQVVGDDVTVRICGEKKAHVKVKVTVERKQAVLREGGVLA